MSYHRRPLGFKTGDPTNASKPLFESVFKLQIHICVKGGLSSQGEASSFFLAAKAVALVGTRAAINPVTIVRAFMSLSVPFYEPIINLFTEN